MSENRFPRVTVVTATYNRADLLPETVDSILAQDYPNLEYLVLDDGSSDNTAQVMQPYLEKYPDIVRFHRHENMGEARTVNRGWDLATGDYLMVVSSDDPQANPMLIRRMVETLEAYPDAVAAFPDWHVIDENSRPVQDYRLGDWDLHYMVHNIHCFIGPGALINRKKLFGRIPYLRNPQFRYVSDYECWLRIGLHGPFKHVPEFLAAWRRHEGATTLQNIGMRIASEQKVLFDYYFDLPDLPPHIRREEKRVKSYLFLVVAKHGLRSQPLLSLRHLFRSFTTSPADFVSFNLRLAKSRAKKALQFFKVPLKTPDTH